MVRDECLYYCNQCLKAFTNAGSFFKHKCEKKRKRKKTCRLCGKSYFNDVYYKKHAEKCNKDPSKKCQFCGKNYFYDASFKRHVEKCNKIEELLSTTGFVRKKALSTNNGKTS